MGSGLRRTGARDLVLNVVAASPLVPRAARWAVYRAWGVRTDSKAIMPGCFVGGSGLSVGPRTFINYGCFFDTSAPITVGADCSFGMQVLVCTSTHERGDPSRRGGALTGRPVEIGDGCWIGARAVLLPGVRVGAGCVIAAGAVVTRDCEPDGLYAGNPAVRTRDLTVPAG